MSKTTYLKSAFKTLSRYDKITQARIVEAVDKIPQGDVKRLKTRNNPPLYRLRVGKYRIIYYINMDNDEVVIAKIDLRGDIYK